MATILHSQCTDVHIPTHMTLTEFIMREAMQYEDKVAFVDPLTSREMTFKEFHKYTMAASGALYRRGVRKGDFVCICCPNIMEYGVIFHAVVSLGAIVTTVNPLYTAEELTKQLVDCEPTCMVTVPMFVKMVDAACAKYGRMKNKFLIGDTSGVPGYESFSVLMNEEGEAPPPVTMNVKEDLCCLPYSSGTTGVPKGVMLTHYNMIANICQASHPDFLVREDIEVILAVLPFFHIYGIIVILNIGLFVGSKTVILPKFDLELYLRCIQDYKVTALYIVPPLAVVLSKHPLVSQFDTSSVRGVHSGAAPLSASLTAELQEKMPDIHHIKQGYGLTETSPVVTMSGALVKLGSAGQLIPCTELKVIDLESGVALSSYKDGEICVRGPQVMKGYHGKEAATKATIDSEGWLHTGDIGYYDKDGDLFIIDRLKELIKYKGFQVAPAELEGLLLTHPAVADAAVIGAPDYLSGELPRAFVVLKPGAAASAEDIIKFVDGQVAPHKKLRGGVEFMKEIPKSPSGKILRRVLKQQIQNKSKL